MPSPLGHALGGIAAGWIVAPPRDRSVAGTLRSGALFAALALVPDVDLLLDQHQGPTHSLGAALIAGLAVGAFTRQGRLGAAAACAYATHILLDWLGADTAPPFGIMALWPVTREHYLSRVDLFLGVLRRNRRGILVVQPEVDARELLILAPVAWLVFQLRVRPALAESLSTGRTPGRSCVPAARRRPSGGAADTAGTSDRPGRRAALP